MNGISERKESKLKMYCPCMLTTTNLLMGVMVIYFMILDRGNSINRLLPYLIMFAGFCDLLDGRLARKFNAESHFGKELDSFADSISFGIAPVTLVAFNLVEYAGILGSLAMIIFPLAGVYRLARFNVTESDGCYFEGLPIPVAGVGLAIKHIVATSLNLQGSALYIDAYLTCIFMIAASILMVSRIKVKKV